MRALILALLCCSSLALGGCTKSGAPEGAAGLEAGASERAAVTDAPAASNPVPGPAAPAGRSPDRVTAVPPDQAPPKSDPLPPERVPVAGNPLAPDVSCRTSADCAVKNVGNCCGMMPACVNKGAATDPAAVKAQCEREGQMSVCGFKDVQACACVAGTCEDAGGAIAQ